MGLDMYLYASKYVSSSEAFEKDSPTRFAEIVKAVGADDFPKPEYGSATVDIQVGYWRKANAIHDWFVKNCQGGEDKCQKAYVSRDSLITLREACRAVLSEKGNQENAEKYLPTASGFFFGGTEYDEYYWDYVESTIVTINTLLLAVPEDWDFTYQSSW
jgi:hypothetical protein